MPPVFGPVSPSPTRLKSWAAGSAIALWPSQIAKTEISSPSSSSSITGSPPSAAPRGVPRRAPSPCGRRRPPCPQRDRPPSRRTAVARPSLAGMGTPAAFITSLAKDFEPSIRAAAALGPNTATPACRSVSATPATSGPSGPTTTRSMPSVSREPEQPFCVLGAHRMALAERAIPGLPGAACSAASRALRASFQASACSRPPEPTTSTLTGRVYSASRRDSDRRRGLTPGLALRGPWSCSSVRPASSPRRA